MRPWRKTLRPVVLDGQASFPRSFGGQAGRAFVGGVAALEGPAVDHELRCLEALKQGGACKSVVRNLHPKLRTKGGGAFWPEILHAQRELLTPDGMRRGRHQKNREPDGPAGHEGVRGYTDRTMAEEEPWLCPFSPKVR